MPTDADDDPTDGGGDPACWAHLFDVEPAVDNVLLADTMRRLADAVIICDPDGQITFWNDSATRIFGWTAEEALGQTLDLIVPERFRTRHWDGWNRTMETGTTRYGDRLLEVPALRRDGTPLSIAFTVTLLTTGEQLRPTAIAAVIRDETESWHRRRELEAEVARLNQAGHA